MNGKLQSGLSVTLISTLSLMGAAPAIGVVTAEAGFHINQAAAYGNGTLFDGALLETSQVRSDVILTSGGRIAVGPNSKTRIYRTYAVLEAGAADVNAANYQLRAANLSIAGSGAKVVLDSPTKVRVGAMLTPVEVRNSSGMLIARVIPGHALAFDAAGAGGGQAGASGPVTITGKLVKNGDQYTVTDQSTNVTYVVQGADLAGEVGKTVTVVGSIVPGTAGAVPVIAATSVVGAAAAVTGGLSTTAIVGITVTGAIGAGLGIAAGVGAFSSASGK